MQRRESHSCNIHLEKGQGLIENAFIIILKMEVIISVLDWRLHAFTETCGQSFVEY